MKASNEKKIIDIIKKCYAREEKPGDKWQYCKKYNAYCVECLQACEYIKQIVDDISTKEERHQEKSETDAKPRKKAKT